jgi:hypothetical protein
MSIPNEFENADPSLLGVVMIVGTGDAGLVLSDGHRRWTVAWASIDSVFAARVPDDDRRVTVLAIGLESRTVIAAETDEVWLSLVSDLQRRLDTEEYAVWGPGLDAYPAPRPLYRR